MSRRILMILFVCFSGLLFGQSKDADCNNQEFTKTVSKYLSYSVPVLSTEELYSDQEEYIILDAREMDEYFVSHIPGAMWVGHENPDYSILENINEDAKIIVYCSIGYRSEKIAEHIQKKGFDNVYNLFGSIFEWANDDLPLVNGKGDEVFEVHTYNKKWGKWMENSKYQKVY